MREIKFRAWDTTRSKMFPDIHKRIDFCEILHMPEPFTVMQYVGLKDKNGKEIYDGDIVKRMYPKYIYSVTDEGDAADMKWVEDISFIVYTNHGFWVSKEHFGWEGEGLWDWDSIEVIGNIYENPGLVAKSDAVQVSDTPR